MAKGRKKKAEPTKTKQSNFRFDDDVLLMLDQLCVIHSRNATNMLEVLIKEAAAKEKIKVKKP